MYGIPQDILDRVAARRGRLHALEHIDPGRTALLVVDMQNYFLKPGFQGEIPAARDIVPAINRAARALRQSGGTVVWIQTASDGADLDWSFMHGHMVTPDRSKRRLRELASGTEGFALWPHLDTHPGDVYVIKRRYSAFLQGSSDLEAQLRSRSIDTVLVTGTATNVCCESTVRDAMMLNFKSVMLADGLAAHTTPAHIASLTNCLLFFSDVMNVDEAAARFAPQTATA